VVKEKEHKLRLKSIEHRLRGSMWDMAKQLRIAMWDMAIAEEARKAAEEAWKAMKIGLAISNDSDIF